MEYNIYELLSDKGYKEIHRKLYAKNEWSWYYPNKKLNLDEKIMFYLSILLLKIDSAWFRFKDRVIREKASNSIIFHWLYDFITKADI